MVGDQHVHEAEQDRAGEGNLEPPEDVLLPSAEENEYTCADRRDPSGYARPTHDDA